MFKKTKTIALVILAIIVSIEAGTGANATDADNIPKIIKAEYNDKELSKDRQNPTVLPMTDYEVSIILTSNACAELNHINVVGYTQGDSRYEGGYKVESEDKWVYNIKLHRQMYVNNDVFEYSWSIIDNSDYKSGMCFEGYLIPGSESPTYYVTYNAGESKYIPPPGNVPEVVRIELNGVELSKDKNNPTTIPFYNKIKILGNSACISKMENLYASFNGEQPYYSNIIYFNSSAEASCSLPSLTNPVSPKKTDESQLYNKVYKMELPIMYHFDDNYKQILTKTPVYYIYVPGLESLYVDAAAEGLLRSIRLTENRLIITAGHNYVFDGYYMAIMDTVTGKKFMLDLTRKNPDYTGIGTDRLEFSNLSLDINHTYVLTIPERMIYYKSGADIDDYNNTKFNREYKTTLKPGDELNFGVKYKDIANDIKEDGALNLNDNYNDNYFVQAIMYISNKISLFMHTFAHSKSE